MLLSHESPICLMDYIAKFCDYNYYLDIFSNDRYYNDCFRKYKKTIYLDCSLYERACRSSIEDLDYGIYLALYNKLSKISDTYMIIPDYLNSMDKNIESLHEFSDIKAKKIITVHGSDEEEYISCLRYYLDNTSDEIIALSAGDSWCNDESRSNIIQKVDIDNRKIHFLGLKSPRELDYIKEVKDKIYSLDTSLPVISTLVDKHVSEIDKKPNVIIFDIFNDEISVDYELLEENLGYIRNLLG